MLFSFSTTLTSFLRIAVTAAEGTIVIKRCLQATSGWTESIFVSKHFLSNGENHFISQKADILPPLIRSIQHLIAMFTSTLHLM